ncbi:putative nucleic acid-binding protein [Mycoplana sp. BE70]|nr:putative nucleic acid-binding protein [Mycoplana sp. BE70]
MSYQEYEKLSHVPSFGRLLGAFPATKSIFRRGPVSRTAPSTSDVPRRHQRHFGARAVEAGRGGALVNWLDRASPYLFLSVVSAAEVAAGIAKAQHEGATTKPRALRDGWSAIEYLYSERLLPFDLKCANAAGAILDHARAHKPGFEVATAQVLGLTVLTRNTCHFEPLGVPVIDPFNTLPKLP